MKLTRTDRSLIAWTLYCCVLFTAFACSVGHGQMAGLQLSGVDGLYCSAAGNTDPSVDFPVSPTLNPAGGFACALCSSVPGLALASSFGLLGWLSRRQATPGSLPALLGWPVRYLWPSANPRASPLLA